ncbi:MAG: sugar transferase [Thermoleophilia bacterium]|nr:sugar transferase [Thermoleophilia bacterium]
MTSATAASESAAPEYAEGASEAASAQLERRRLKPRTEWALGRLSLDVAMLAVAVTLAEAGWRSAGFPPTPTIAFLAFPALALLFLYARGAYVSRVRGQLLDELRIILGGTAIAAMAVTTARVVVADEAIPSSQAVRPWLFATAALVAGRTVLTRVERARRAEATGRPTLILGAGRVGQLLARRLVERAEFGLRPIGFLDKEPLGPVDGVPVLGASWDFDAVVGRYDVQHVVATFSTAPHEVVLRVARRCEELGISFSFVPRLFEKVPERVTIDHVGGMPLVTPHPVDPHGWQFAVKYAADRLIAAALILLALPVLAVSALAVLVTMGRPVFFEQRRLGLDGREFGMVKFRTMDGKPEVSGEADADWAARELGAQPLPARLPARLEDRRTPVGRVLRRLSVDELPQLFNVLRGEMSLVGPRPERVDYARRFEERIYRYAERHRVKSGLTGWAQVNGLRGKTSLADRVEWDNYYIENWSLWLDAKIVIRTLAAVVRSSS